jgi:hypothetical protein
MLGGIIMVVYISHGTLGNGVSIPRPAKIRSSRIGEYIPDQKDRETKGRRENRGERECPKIGGTGR